jgi:transcriptional regulator with XRE-family HTH domain
MTSEQLRMARALLRLGLRELAAMSGVDKMAISRMEAGARSHAATVTKLKATLEKMGIVFIGAAEPVHGPTVGMRWGMEPPVASEAGEEEGMDDETPSREARAWEDADAAPDAGQIEGLREYWSDAERWSRLSDASRRSLARTMGQVQF